MSTETMLLTAALVCSGVYITYLHSQLNYVRKQAHAIGAMLMYTMDALDEKIEEDE